ncbi:MAG TPA: hypothetical protein VFZ36_09150 [Vicinamibacterales bacterium]
MAAAAGACGSSPTAPLAAVTAISATPSPDTATTQRSTTLAGLTATGVTPVLDARGNPTCKDLAATYGAGATWFEVKLDRLPNATDGVADDAISVSITNGGANGFNWTATRGVDAVLVKAGNGPHNVYLYSPEAAADSGVVTADKYAISHITFCYDVELEVAKTADTTFTRDYDWTIAKSVDQAALTIESTGQAAVNYSVAVTKDAGTDSDWAVGGSITVTNPHPTIAASGISVSDNLSGFGALAVSCPATSLAGGASMTCSYATTALPNGGARTNTATAASTSYGFAAGTGAAPVSFVTPTTVLDNSVSVSDSFAGAGLSGTTLAASKTFTYARTIAGSSFTCGTTSTVGNIASIAADDGVTRSASANVSVAVTCPPPASTGCTLTQGYWGTHSSKGPAKYDATWALIGEDTPFYQSGTSYYGALQLPTKGNAYYVLAHQFIAAKLNVLKGAAAPAGVNMAAIDTFFSTYTPGQIAALKGANSVRAQALAWAATLDSYNNGLLNAAHCD